VQGGAVSKLWNLYETGKVQEYEALKKVCLEVVTEFPGLSASAFFEEVRGRIYPRPDEYDMRGAVLMLVGDGVLDYTKDWKVVKA
jgi:hypothetical protein